MAPSVLQYGGKMGNKKSDETYTQSNYVWRVLQDAPSDGEEGGTARE